MTRLLHLPCRVQVSLGFFLSILVLCAGTAYGEAIFGGAGATVTHGGGFGGTPKEEFLEGPFPLIPPL